MALDDKTLDQLAEHLHACQREARDTLKVTDDHPDMTWDDAYAIQDRILAAKLAGGAHLAGYKAGLTSHAKMKQMGVTDPVFGFLVDEFMVPAGGEVQTSELIHPKVEPEICFVTRHELQGPGCSIASVLAASDIVLPGIEVIDSRYRDFKFDLKSVVADNTSASRFVVGGHAVDARSVDLRTTGIVLEKNGQVVATGAGAAVVGHPAAAVAMLVNHLGRRGKTLPAGALVFSGGITAAVAVTAGDNLTLSVQGMGSVGVRFV
ncbi:MAG: 2-oxo-3-hexenedioate decarboxylase [Ottowia sp.]|nr:2-oxo-3-hexenedioate decarboxylase [Ottowia sp.]